MTVVLALIIGFGAYRYTRPLPMLYPFQTIKTNRSSYTKLAWPDSGQSAVGALGYGVLDSSGPQSALPTASTAKLITALTVLKKYPLQPGQSGPIITLSASDVVIYNKYVAEQGSVARVAAGEQISEYQMLQGMMLPSANNLADSLAIWAFGSLPAYKVAATTEVQSLGLKNTFIGSDASGFLPDTRSSASDLVKIGEFVLNNPVLASIANQSTATLPVAGVVRNVNWLLGEDGIIGLKTGNSNQAGGVYIFAAKYSVAPQHLVTIIGAVQNLPTLQTAMDSAIPLLISAQKNFKLTETVKKDETVGFYDVPWANSVNIVAQHAITAVSWSGQTSKPKLSLHTISAPLAARTIVGKASNLSKTGSTELVLNQPISSPPWWWRIIRHNV